MKDLVDDSDDDYGWYYFDGGYGTLVDSFEVETLLEEHDHDYQGDSYYLLKNGHQFGLLAFGWGSCSGCDALQAASSHAEVVALRDRLWESIEWMTPEELAHYVENKDFDTEWYSYSDTGKRFQAALYSYFNIDKEVEND